MAEASRTPAFSSRLRFSIYERARPRMRGRAHFCMAEEWPGLPGDLFHDSRCGVSRTPSIVRFRTSWITEIFRLLRARRGLTRPTTSGIRLAVRAFRVRNESNAYSRLWSNLTFESARLENGSPFNFQLTAVIVSTGQSPTTRHATAGTEDNVRGLSTVHSKQARVRLLIGFLTHMIGCD